MKLRLVAAVALLLLIAASVFALQVRRRLRNPGYDEARVAIEPLYRDDKTEWAFTRLHYDQFRSGYFRSGDGWYTDAPKAENQFVVGVQRLTRLHANYESQVADPNADDIFDQPWIYGVEVGGWTFTDNQAQRLRQYFLRGGFLMVDDFHGSIEWQIFERGLKQIFPDREVEEIPSSDPIFHVSYNLDERSQIPGLQYVYSGSMYEDDGVDPHWRCVRDDNGRIMIAISFNQDVGDAWEWADDPAYPQPWAFQAYQLGINYILYAMTH